MTGNLYSISGEKEGTVVLPKEIFGEKVNSLLLAQAVRVYLTNQRQARAKAKTRAEVTGSNRKIYRQKGTGGARHGDRKAPIFVGGGKAHPPRGFLKRLVLPKKMKRKALLSALSLKAKEKRIIFLEGLNNLKPKTKKAAALLKKLKIEKEKVLLLVDAQQEKAFLSFRNLPLVEEERIGRVNAWQILRNEWLLISKEGLKALKERLTATKKEKRENKN